ncbi:MAG: hypothetical protein QXD05_00060 [Candidatus Pacearchaeota archaeon]
MLRFDFIKFLLDKRMNGYEFSKILSIPNPSAYIMIKRGTIKPSLLKKLEEIYNEDLSRYILSTPQKSKTKINR